MKKTNWENYTLFPRSEQKKLPRVAGVYAIYFDGTLVYIGQSVDIANRFSEHRFRCGYGRDIVTPWCRVPDTTRITVKLRRSQRLGDWAMWEIRLISKLLPVYNANYRKTGAL